jgi:hypothetical protein
VKHSQTRFFCTPGVAPSAQLTSKGHQQHTSTDKQHHGATSCKPLAGKGSTCACRKQPAHKHHTMMTGFLCIGLSMKSQRMQLHSAKQATAQHIPDSSRPLVLSSIFTCNQQQHDGCCNYSASLPRHTLHSAAISQPALTSTQTHLTSPLQHPGPFL